MVDKKEGLSKRDWKILSFDCSLCSHLSSLLLRWKRYTLGRVDEDKRT